MGMKISQFNVRRSLYIQSTAKHVWSEFETFDRFKHWFGIGHALEIYEPKPLGRVELSIDINGDTRAFGGNISVYEPERELSFTNNWFTDHAWPVPTFITIRLTPCYDGIMVELFHHGFDRLGADAAKELQGYEQGWDILHLVALKNIVENQGVNEAFDLNPVE